MRCRWDREWHIPKVRADFVAACGEKRGSSPARYIDDLLMACHLGHLDGVDGAHCVNGETIGAGVFEYAKELVCQKGCGEGKDGSRALFERDVAGRVRARNAGKAGAREVLGKADEAGIELCGLCGGAGRVHVQSAGERGATGEHAGNHRGEKNLAWG